MPTQNELKSNDVVIPAILNDTVFIITEIDMSKGELK